MIDEVIIKRAAKGEDKAFNKIALEYRDKIYSVCLRITKNEHDAFDASQETLIKIYFNLKKFNFKSSLATWIYRIAYNAAIDIVRKRKEYIDIYESESLISAYLENKDGPDIAAEKNETKRELLRAVDSLKEEYKTAVVLRDIDGYSYEEISEITGVPKGTVKSRVSRGRECLRRILYKSGEE